MKVNPWEPISDRTELKILGKFGEELGECNAAVSRCIIQGVDARHPMTGKKNREWLAEEIADVLANIEVVVQRYNLDCEFMQSRADQKLSVLREWHEMK